MRLYFKNLRKQRRMTQTEIALQIGISQNYYSEIENGNRQKKISLDILSKLADVFDVPVAELITEEQKMQSNSQQKGA